ncbi:deaminase, partial [Providencia rettgeri]
MNTEQLSGRREFLTTSAKVVAACTLLGSVSAGAAVQTVPQSGVPRNTDKHYYLDDALLETGFNFRDST